MKKILLSLMLCLFLVSFASAGSEQVVNKTAVDSLIDNPIYANGVFMNGTWNGDWKIAQAFGFHKGDNITQENLPDMLLEYFYYTRYFDDPVIKTLSKPDGSACITEWVCKAGDWVKEDWMHPKRVEECITNYNEGNCAVAERTWNRIIPGRYCVVLNDNGIGAKPKPTESCAVETIQEEQTETSEDEINVQLAEGEPVEFIVDKPKRSWWKYIFFWVD